MSVPDTAAREVRVGQRYRARPVPGVDGPAGSECEVLAVEQGRATYPDGAQHEVAFAQLRSPTGSTLFVRVEHLADEAFWERLPEPPAVEGA